MATNSVFRSRFFVPKLSQAYKKSSTQAGSQFQQKLKIKLRNDNFR